MPGLRVVIEGRHFVLELRVGGHLLPFVSAVVLEVAVRFSLFPVFIWGMPSEGFVAVLSAGLFCFPALSSPRSMRVEESCRIIGAPWCVSLWHCFMTLFFKIMILLPLNRLLT